MGFNFNWSNKHERDIQIEKARGEVAKNDSNNRVLIEKETNRTNLLMEVLAKVIDLFFALIGDSKQDKQ